MMHTTVLRICTVSFDDFFLSTPFITYNTSTVVGVMKMMSFRASLPAVALVLFFLIALVHADIDKKFEKFFRDRHDRDNGGSTVTVRHV